MAVHERTGKHSLLIAPQAMTNSATVTANFDRNSVLGADYAEIIVNLASEINTNAVGPTISLLESDDTVVTNFATITADQTAVDITDAAQVVYSVDLRGRKRYLRLSVTTATATNDDVTVSAGVKATRLDIGPSGTTGVADVVVYV